MQDGSREFLQKLMYHTHPNDFDLFLKYFDEKERNLLAALPKHPEPIALHLDHAETYLHKFHYSWFIESFEKCSQSLRKRLLTLFDPYQREKLAKYLNVKAAEKEFAPVVKKFFTQWLLKELGYHLIPPTCFFSHSKCMKLMQVGKIELVSLLHQLGILEIANIAKRIVDKKTLNELLKFLTPGQKKLFLSAQKKYNEPLASSTTNLRKRLQDDRSFLNFLEKKGILRLAKALASEDSFFIWHFAHILDKGRGKEFLSVVRRCMPNASTPYYLKQVLEICQSLEENQEVI